MNHQPFLLRNALLALCIIAPSSAAAQSAPRALTPADYARAERFMSYNVTPLVSGTGVRPTWLRDERFWYRTSTPDGTALFLVDPARHTRARAFDPARLSDAIVQAGGQRIDARQLPFDAMTISGVAGHDTVAFETDDRRWRCDLQDNRCSASDVAREQSSGGRGRGGRGPRNDVLSPDGKRTVFIRDWNLWVRDVASGRTTQLTTDGVKDFGYATDNAGWALSDRAIVLWSPDSRKVATFQQDQRGTGEMYLVDTRVGHPNLQAWKYPLPGDSVAAVIQRVVIDVDSPRVVRFRMPLDQHRSTLCDDVACRGDWSDVQWSLDSRSVAFISTSRDHKQEHVRVADASTGIIRDVLEETVPTFYESGNGRANWKYLPNSNELIWFSERDDWGQLYLYDLTTGKLKQQITTGAGNVTQLLRVDEKNRVLYFLGVGKELGRDPYFRHLYRIGMNGKGLQLLTPENADHDVTLASSGNWVVDSYSRPDVPPVTVLRDASGKLVETLERGDISRLVAAGWRPPMPITVKARDGRTDLYGLLFRPTSFDSTKKYPIV